MVPISVLLARYGALLHDDIMALPVDDPRREAWLAVDRLSSQWVSSWPGLDTPLQPALGDAEFGPAIDLVRAPAAATAPRNESSVALRREDARNVGRQ